MSAMSPAMIGALAGAVLGLLNFAVLRSVAARAEGMNPTPEKRRTGSILRMVALADLMVFPLVGWFVGPLVLN